MATSKLKPAILIVSETASKDPTSDRSSSILSEVFAAADDSWAEPVSKILPDNVLEIQSAIQAWTDKDDTAMNLIVTSGGTGFAQKDVTPEAVAPLLHKHASGIVHGMLAASSAVTPFGLLSRPVAGVRNKTLIITVPGSPKGAKENLEAVIKLLPHACQQAAGANSRQLHVGGVEKLEKDAGVHSQGITIKDQSQQPHHHGHDHDHSHSHGHGHRGHEAPSAHTNQLDEYQSNDPSLGPSRRSRASPYPMLSVEDALKQIASNVPPPIIIPHKVDQGIVGHVLAEDVKAVEAVPAFRASVVDGYAVHIPEGAKSNTKGVFPVAFSSHAQATERQTLKPGQLARITTGAALPPGSSAVVMVEDTLLHAKTEDGSEEAEIEILTDKVVAGENVREIGSDVKAGDVVMRKGEGISAIGGEFGLLASVGAQDVQVFKQPRVGVLSTGDEIVPHDRPGELKLGEVRDTNRPTLLTAVTAQGFEAIDLGIASDKPEGLEARLCEGLASVDILITSGGVSMGELDLLKPTIERALSGIIHFGRVSMKPGKPTTFATVPHNASSAGQTSDDSSSFKHKVIFSLPGNPASAVVTFMLFVLPALHQMSGVTPAGLPQIPVRLDSTVDCDAKREEFCRVIVSAKSGDDSGLWATSTGGQRSSRIGSFKGANALVRLPAGAGKLDRGAQVEALMMGVSNGVVAL